MANREELGLIRGARGGLPDAQLALGRLYLYGSAGLPKSLPTALHWLDRAAQQGCGQACELIGAYIPLELARQSPRPLVQWYERAYDAGVLRAGMVLAQLTLDNEGAGAAGGPDQARRAKAMRALEAAARGGLAEAQWLVARYRGSSAPEPEAAPAVAQPPRRPSGPALPGVAQPAASRPAAPLRHPALEQLWQAGQREAWLAEALPLARALVPESGGAREPGACLNAEDIVLLSRCSRVLDGRPGVLGEEAQRYREIAAAEHDPHAQMALGLWYARMQADGTRVGGAGSATFKKAIRWLSLAGQQGLAEAWYALSRIYVKPEFSQRNIADAQTYLERAADMGYRDAQLECGISAWRARREHEGNDVRAVYWLQKAAAQGCAQAAAALRKIAPRAAPCAFAQLAGSAAAGIEPRYPLLAARLRLAALFGLSRAEALLLDVNAADQGHCLVIDIRASYGRSKRRLVEVGSAAERVGLDQVLQQFAALDSGPAGPEGNYRQRLYRLKTVLPEAVGQEEGEGVAYRLAA